MVHKKEIQANEVLVQSESVSKGKGRQIPQLKDGQEEELSLSLLFYLVPQQTG